jgi:succinate dehydrogenase / fumarate reductase cytochrome b subunit
MPARVRPLSPHIDIYRWQMSNTLSILHRVTGVALSIGLPALSYWLIAIAGGREAYANAMRIFSSPVAAIAIAGWTFAFFYHLLNGVRHLFWDAGFGFERTVRRLSGWTTVAGSVLLTGLAWWAMWQGPHP